MNLYVQITADGTVGSTLITSGSLPEGYTDVSRESERDAIERRERRWDGEAWVPWAPPPPPPNTRLSHADVLGLLTPAEWAEMNKFRPGASGTHAGGTPYDDALVFWAVSVFNAAAYVDVADPRTGQILQALVGKRLLTTERASALQQAMAALAASKAGG